LGENTPPHTKPESQSDVVLIAQDTTQLIREMTKSTEFIKGIRKTEKVSTTPKHFSCQRFRS